MFVFTIKKVIENIPTPLGKLYKYIPYSLRLGNGYKSSTRDIAVFENLDESRKKEFIFCRCKKSVDFAYKNVPFYSDFYIKHGFSPSILRDFSDLSKIPIVTKADLQKCDIRRRSFHQMGRLLCNTGGSSGMPLHFFLDSQAFAREWGHMHHIWAQKGYSQKDLKLTLRGKNLGKHSVKYNPVHNEYMINAYANIEIAIQALKKIVCKEEIRYMHGYPSRIYDFARHLKETDQETLNVLRSSLLCIFLGSEYPQEVFRKEIEDTFKVPTLSWYGHSEMAILAYERRLQYHYEPFQTYGFCEAIASPDKNSYRLIGTSFYNTASPFIRYDTGDLIIPEIKNDLLVSFIVQQGRIGDFLIDKHGASISLTAFLFGRHHRIFNYARFIQLCQKQNGKVTIIVTLKDTKKTVCEIEKDFDLTNIDIDFDFEMKQSPIVTSAGKIPLLVPQYLLKKSN